MKQFLLNLLLKWSGANMVWEKLDGWKTYGSAALSILTGLAGLAAELAGPLSAHSLPGLVAVIQNLPHDPSWAALVFGLGLLGVGHKLEKAAVSPSVPEPSSDSPAS